MNIKNNHSGFTLVEAVVSLIIVSVGLLLISFFSEIVNRGTHYSYETTNFYSYLNQFENPNNQLLSVSNSHLLLKDRQSRKRYRINVKKQTLLLTGIRNRGYVPLIDNVKSVRWYYHHHLLSTKLIMRDGNKYQANSVMKLGG